MTDTLTADPDAPPASLERLSELLEELKVLLVLQLVGNDRTGIVTVLDNADRNYAPFDEWESNKIRQVARLMRWVTAVRQDPDDPVIP